MKKYKFLTVMCVLVSAVFLLWGIKQVLAEPSTDAQSIGQSEQQKSAYQRRQEALQRLQEATGEELPQKATEAVPQAGAKALSLSPKAAHHKVGAKAISLPPGPLVGFNPAVDYNLSNFAYSPNIRKFVDSLPGLSAANQNNLGQYIPVANPDTNTYSGSDYYVLGIKQYRKQMNSDLPAVGTALRGYYQKNSGTVGATDGNSQYLGPLIIARSYDPTKPVDVNGNGRPVRIMFVNELGIGTAGDLPLPVDMTVMGAGMGPIAGQNYTQNRAAIHLHGGNTPWISDGTPHQWITPAGDPTPYKKGASFQNVPDMIGTGKSIPVPDANDGKGTLYYTNQQSARLMFYHDHAYGITRLNVYAGEAAGYVLVDQVEDDMIDGTNVSGAFTTPKAVLPDQNTPAGVYRYGIPLVIQDKTFVNDANTPPDVNFTGTPTPATLTVDPLWATYVGTGGGNFWFPHEYIPNENIYDPNGFNVKGRWDYGPWINPVFIPLNLTLPSPTIIPEAFQDTAIVNGCAFPYVTLPPTAIRFRILNACNDRFLNLQFYYADPNNPTEVNMVPAVPRNDYPSWPRDGRDGGVPDPLTAGPNMIQIGNEGGLLPQVAVIPAQPVDFDYNRRSITFGGIASQSLMLLPAERADVIVDFSSCAPGSTLILYNDAPAPSPLFDTRNDCYTGDADQTAVGGAPTTSAGYGPNIRTIMQIRIDPCGTPTATFDLASLQTALPEAYGATQAPPIVPQAAYNAAFGTANGDTYANNVTESLNLTGTTQPVAKVVTVLPGSGYVTAPTVTFIGGGGSGAAATATLNGVSAITVTVAGTGYTSAPTVKITGGGGTGATAVASITGGGVSAIAVVNPGSNYTTNPVVAITGGGGAGATATSGITLGAVGQITLTSGGSGYTAAPQVFLTGGGGTGAVADCMLNGSLPIGMKNITEGMDITYGRMNAMLGTTPVPLDPLAPAPQVPGIAQYIDPPSDFWTDGQTYLFRVAHLGVDNHIVHFHLANLQVVNRVDYTNTILPPYDNELGWKESIRTNPFTDLILAVRPVSQVLPFQVPQSNRLMDVTTVAGSTANYVQAALVPGLPNPAGISNVMTNYGWEYVWHCHLLGHEENDMMRPIVFLIPLANAPSGLALRVTTGNAPIEIQVNWVDNSANELGFTVQRATNSAFTAGLKTFTITGPNTTTYVDTDNSLLGRTRYYYRVSAWTQGGNSAWSNTANILTAAGPLPAAPSGLTVGTITRTSVVLRWTNNATNQTGVVIQRATNAGFTTGRLSTTVNTPTLTTRTMTGLRRNTTYYFRVAARNAAGNGAWSNVVTFKTLP